MHYLEQAKREIDEQYPYMQTGMVTFRHALVAERARNLELLEVLTKLLSRFPTDETIDALAPDKGPNTRPAPMSGYFTGDEIKAIRSALKRTEP